MKKIIFGVLALLLLTVAGGAAFAMFASGERLRPIAEWAASWSMGQDVAIGGLEVDRGEITTLTATNITLANADWAGDEPLGEIETAVVAFKFWSLLDPRIDVLRVEVSGATARPTFGPDGRSNWEDVDADAPAPDDRAEAPILRSIKLIDIRVLYGSVDDAGTVTVLHEMRIDTGKGAAAPAEPVGFAAKGTYRDQPLTITAKGDAFAVLVAGSAPYNFALAADGAVKAAITGVLAPDSSLSDLDLELSGPTIAALAPFAPVPLPDTPPFSIAGRMVVSDGAYGMTGLSGKIGDSDIAGEAKIDLTGERPLLTGALTSDSFDFDDFAGLIGAVPDPSETANAEQKQEAARAPLIPDVPLPVADLRRANIDLSFKATKVSSPVAQVESIDARVRLDNGRLLVKPLKVGVSDGTAQGEIAVNVRDDIPSADIDLTVTDVSLSKFFATSQFAQEMGGSISGDIYVLGVGASLSDMFSSARGGGHMILRDGKVSALLVEGAGVDITEALGLLIAGDVAIPMECAVAAVDINDGLLRIEKGAASTSDSLVITTGHVDLGAKTVRMQVEARAKDFSLIDLNVPVLIEGPLAEPGFSLGGLDPLPFFELGEAEGANCDLLICEAKEAAPGEPD